MKRALFPGSFDPFTKGHYDIVMRTLSFMDEVVIGISIDNYKHCMFTPQQRLEHIRKVVGNDPRIQVCTYNGLTVDFAKETGSQVIVRGVRSVRDYEYEQNMADINKQIGGIETILLYTHPAYSSISSSIVRQLIQVGKDVTDFLPKGITLLLFLLLSVSTMAQSNKTFKESAARKLQMAEFAISNLYVDSVDEHKLVETAIIKMLEELDPHSLYSNADEVKKLTEPLQGNFEGIGIQYNMAEDTLFVIQPISGGPSEKVGILAGDRIITVNDTLIAGKKLTTDQITSRLKGPKGSEVTVQVLRRGVKELLPFTIKRDKIPVFSLDASYMIAPEVGYIKINRFAATTHQEFQKALFALQAKGMKSLILDLQGNGGGYLGAATDLANDFLEKSELIVYTEGRRAPRSQFQAKGNGHFQKGKLIVLVDEYSASASEIVTGAIQDWDRGLVVGRRTFGKGLVQRPIDLPDGSMIRLTVSRYYTPSGRCIQRPYNNKQAYSMDLIERYNKGEMMSADSIHFPDSLKFYTHKLGRTVYGGGGIMPDYFVPVDTTQFTRYHRMLSVKGVLLKVHFQLIDTYRKEWNKKYKTFNDFNQRFELSEAQFQQLVDAGRADGVEPASEEEKEKSKAMLKLQMKALIARDLWDMNEYYQVMNTVNNSVQKALELMNTDFWK